MTSLLCFHVLQDENRIWRVESVTGSRVYARTPYKETAVELARRVAKRRAPAKVRLFSSSGQVQKVWTYRTKGSSVSSDSQRVDDELVEQDDLGDIPEF